MRSIASMLLCATLGACTGPGPAPAVTAASITPCPARDPLPTPLAMGMSPVPEALDAPAYAEAFGVPLEEAIRRSFVQEELEHWLAPLRSSLGPAFDVVWLEHEPEYRVVIRVTTDASAEEVCAQIVDWPLVVAVETGATHTEADLLRGMEAIDDLLHSRYPEMSMGTDTQRNMIVISGPEEPSPGFLARLADLAGVPVRHERGGTPQLLDGGER